MIPRVWKLLLGQVQRHPSPACVSPPHHSSRTGLSQAWTHILPAWGAVGSEGNSRNSPQCCSAHQENRTRLILPQIQFKVKCSTDCSNMCISSYFHLEGRFHLEGCCHLETPQCRLWLGLHSWVKLLSVASQHSYKQIIPGQHNVLLKRRIMNT